MKFTFNVLLFLISTGLLAQSAYEEKIRTWQSELNAAFSDEEESPLTKKERKKFEGLDFFPIDSSYSIEAKFVRTPNQLPFTMPTTTDRLPVYEKYGEAHFHLQGKPIVLNIYQNHSLRTQEEYEDYLFLPFTDLTNGFESYGGGRYIDLKIPESDTITIDFNKAYNPYCAYNPDYSCPIPPRKNDLDLEIEAGVKNWKK